MTNPPIHQQLTRHSNQQTRITLIKTKGQPPDQSRLPTTRSLIESLITQSKPIPITIHHPMRTNSQSKVIKTITISPIKLNSRLTDHQPMNHTTKRQNQGLISKPLPDHNSRIKWNQQTTTSLNNTTRIKPWPHKPRVKQKWVSWARTQSFSILSLSLPLWSQPLRIQALVYLSMTLTWELHFENTNIQL